MNTKKGKVRYEEKGNASFVKSRLDGIREFITKFKSTAGTRRFDEKRRILSPLVSQF